MRSALAFLLFLLIAVSSRAEVVIDRFYISNTDGYTIGIHLTTAAEYGNDYFLIELLGNGFVIDELFLPSQGEGDTLRHYSMYYSDFGLPGFQITTLNISAVDTAGAEDLLIGGVPTGPVPANVAVFTASYEGDHVLLDLSLERSSELPTTFWIESRVHGQWQETRLGNFIVPGNGILDTVMVDSSAAPGFTYTYSVFGSIPYWNEWGIPSGVACLLASDTVLVPEASSAPATLLPREVGLSIYPNPFNNAATVSFDLAVAADIRLFVTDILGRHVVTLVDRLTEPGHHSVRFSEQQLAGGMYVVSLSVNGVAESKKMLLLK